MILHKDEIWDYVRVVNVAGDKDFQATKEEKVIIGHRDNPVLGNKHPMKVKTRQERLRVIAEYKKDLQEDISNHGPIWHVLQAIARDIVENGQKCALQCFCSPAQCHLDLLIPIIVDMAQVMWEHKHQATHPKPRI